jgi:NAD(P)H-nitrite reductase large subunit
VSDSETICFCHAVTEGEIREAVQAGAKTMAEIQAQTCASTGCGGCYYDVESILEFVTR